MSDNEKKNGLIPYRWEMLGLLWVAFLFNQADRAMFGFVMPLIKTDLNLTDVQLGIVASTFHIFYGVLAPFAGYAGDVFRRSRIVVASIFTWSLATLLTGMSTTMAHLIVFRGASLSFGEAFYLTSANSLIGQYHEKTRALAMSIHQTALYCGMIGSGALAGYLGMKYGWRSPFLLFGALGIFWAVVLFLRLKDPETKKVEAEKPAARIAVNRIPVSEVFSYIAGKPSIVVFAFVFGCLVFVNVGYVTWMPTLLHEDFSLSLPNAGFSSMFYHVIGAFAGVLLGGKLSDFLATKRYNGRLVLAGVGFFGCIPFVYLMGRGTFLPFALFGVGGFGFFRGICDSTFFPLLFDVVEPKYRSSCQGFVICFGLIIGAVAPIALGHIKTTIGLNWGIASMSLVSLTGCLLVLVTQLLFFKRDHIDS